MKTPASLVLLSLPLLFLCLSGCVSLQDTHDRVWPWEYARGKGEPETSDYFSLRSGVAKFGEAPQPLKPVSPADVAPTPAGEQSTPPPPPSAATPATNRETESQPADADNVFRVTETPSVSRSSLLGTTRPAYDITASNRGDAPVSVAIMLDQGSTQNMAADRTLPSYGVVPAHSERILLHLAPKNEAVPFRFRYSYRWTIGDYTARHDCPEAYRFPFGEKVRAFASVNAATNASAYTRYAVVFSVPAGTPVLAARKGIVVRISGNEAIDVLHEDATIGTYSHLERIGDRIAVGTAVAAGDQLGVAGEAEDQKGAYLQLAVWRPEPASGEAWRAPPQRMELVPVSFPLAFRSTATGKSRILMQNQAVGSVPVASSRKKHRR